MVIGSGLPGTSKIVLKLMFDALGEVLTQKEIKFLAEVLTEAWFALDVRNMDTEKRKMYSSIKSKIARLNK